MDFHLVETSPDYLLGILSAEGEIKFLVASSPIRAVCLWKVGSVWQRATEEEGEDDVDKSLGYVFYSIQPSITLARTGTPFQTPAEISCGGHWRFN